MTAITHSPSRSAAERQPMNRILAVVRLNFVNTWTVLIVPLMILGFILLINIAIWAIVLNSIGDEAGKADARVGFSYTGASFYVFIYMMVVALQAYNLTFPFALGYGVTRRDFYLGTSLAFTLLSAMWATVLTVMSYIEDLTHGWGLGGQMFTAVYFGDNSGVARFAMYFCLFMFFFFFGSVIAAVYSRWKVNGTLLFFAVLVVGLVGLIALATYTQNWPAVGAWFVSNRAVGLALWSLIPTVLSGIAGYAVIRRATPRN